VVDWRWSAVAPHDARINAGDLIALRPDALFALGAADAKAALAVAGATPVVFAGVRATAVTDVADPPQDARNATGFVDFDDAIAASWVRLLAELSPGIRQLWFLHEPGNPEDVRLFQALTASAQDAGLEARQVAAGSPDAITLAVQIVGSGYGTGLVVSNAPFLVTSRPQLVGRSRRSGCRPCGATRCSPPRAAS
jgi:ABC-type uncharacterized transport system substrate-binding protein